MDIKSVAIHSEPAGFRFLIEAVVGVRAELDRDDSDNLGATTNRALEAFRNNGAGPGQDAAAEAPAAEASAAEASAAEAPTRRRRSAAAEAPAAEASAAKAPTRRRRSAAAEAPAAAKVIEDMDLVKAASEAGRNLGPVAVKKILESFSDAEGYVIEEVRLLQTQDRQAFLDALTVAQA